MVCVEGCIWNTRTVAAFHHVGGKEGTADLPDVVVVDIGVVGVCKWRVTAGLRPGSMGLHGLYGVLSGV